VPKVPKVKGTKITITCFEPGFIGLKMAFPILLNISHLRCGPVGVRFIESRFAGRHKCRPYKDLKRKFLSNELRGFAPIGAMEYWSDGFN
jgi:hypothetical protein